MTVQEIVDSAKTDVPESVQKFGEQFVAALEQGQKIALDVVGTVTDATASLNGRFIDQVDTGKVPSARRVRGVRLRPCCPDALRAEGIHPQADRRLHPDQALIAGGRLA